MADELPRLVRKRSTDGSDCGLMEIMARCDGPTYVSGPGSWLASLCEEVSAEEAAEYWRREAGRARARAKIAAVKTQGAVDRYADLVDKYVELLEKHGKLKK